MCLMPLVWEEERENMIRYGFELIRDLTLAKELERFGPYLRPTGSKRVISGGQK